MNHACCHPQEEETGWGEVGELTPGWHPSLSRFPRAYMYSTWLHLSPRLSLHVEGQLSVLMEGSQTRIALRSVVWSPM